MGPAVEYEKDERSEDKEDPSEKFHRKVGSKVLGHSFAGYGSID